jgi:hypothetical protein
MADKLPNVDGQRSPRWAFWSHMTIPCQDGLVYLVRLRIVQTPWFGIYLHDIYEPDRDPHNHPWSFISIILRGQYTELFYHAPEVHASAPREQTWRRLSAHRMGRDTAHRIVDAAPGLKTLILTGPRRGGWGFFTRDGYVAWQDYHEGPTTNG